MKKLIILFLLMISSILPIMANVIPERSDSIKNYGIGLMRLNTVVNIYKDKDENSEILQKIYWDSLENYNNLLKIPYNRTFAAYYPRKEYAFLTVVDDDEEGSWYLVCYDQENQLYGWMKQGTTAKFYSWADFIMFFGKKNGLYIFGDNEEKSLYARAEDGATAIDSFTYAKHIEPWFVSGNFLMVKVIDYDNKQKMGYIRWRTDDGRLLVFVKFR